MSTVSVVVPNRKEVYLEKTLAELYNNRSGDIEVFVMHDGPHPAYKLPEYPGLKIIEHPQVTGLKSCINEAAAAAKGKYFMKIDAHCMIGEGWDEILKADCEDNWLILPRRYWLDAPNWRFQIDQNGNIGYVDAMSYLYPFIQLCRPRLVCRPDIPRANLQKDELIVEDMGMQGSCYFMQLEHFRRLGGLSEYGYGTMSAEAEELTLKTQLGPWEGKVMRNKKTWYAHWAKPNSHWRADPEIAGRITDEERESGWLYSFAYWWYNHWTDRVHDFEWLVDKFWPLPNWPDNWRWLSTQYKLPELPAVKSTAKVSVYA